MTARQELPPGTRVRVTVEGTVAISLTDFIVIDDGAFRHRVRRDAPGTVFKVIEPEYADGGVYRDADGEVYRFKDAPCYTGGWERFGRTGTYNFEVPVRPLERVDG